jgi:hypothetical protein
VATTIVPRGPAPPAEPAQTVDDRTVDACVTGRHRLAMGDVTQLRPVGWPKRAVFSDPRGAGLQITWHGDRGLAVLSLWRDDQCVGTFRMSLADAGRLSGFLVTHLTESAVDPLSPGLEPQEPARGGSA